MPLAKGSSSATVSSNIAEMMRSWERKGMIGNTRPRSKAHALEIAKAAAMNAARRSKDSKRRAKRLARHVAKRRPGASVPQRR